MKPLWSMIALLAVSCGSEHSSLHDVNVKRAPVSITTYSVVGDVVEVEAWVHECTVSLEHQISSPGGLNQVTLFSGSKANPCLGPADIKVKKWFQIPVSEFGQESASEIDFVIVNPVSRKGV